MSAKEDDIINKKRQQQKKEQQKPADVLNQDLNTDKNETNAPEKNASRKRVTLEIRSDLHYQLKLRAIQEGKNMYELVEEALEQYFH